MKTVRRFKYQGISYLTNKTLGVLLMNKEEIKLLQKLVKELRTKGNQKPTITDWISTICNIVMALVAVLSLILSVL